ncbi:hypothetical protein [Paraburkholderia sp. CNPSo 3281]|uniref:hypothetical protein n=1 Tax=Paraburkholderia sp. CNPSo 3281 TaxID=2940933 RepID=UPI0020B82ECE|nr:hypothetical protein [Paraburkholderia sp. CNPSo 3281]MCP3721379.1 hypothetical protein [Paraburkholderia sp. CNPSo 3281]
MQLEQTIADATAQTRAISLYGVRNRRTVLSRMVQRMAGVHQPCALPLRVAAGLTR